MIGLSNLGALESEATALSTEPQPLPWYIEMKVQRFIDRSVGWTFLTWWGKK